jgi:hypothetical protein
VGGVGGGDDEYEPVDTYTESDAVIEEALAAGDPLEPAPARPVDRFRRTTAGTVVAAGLFGLRDALEGRPEREEPAVVVEAPSGPGRDRIDVELDFDHPERSRVVIRRPASADEDRRGQ